MRAVRKVKGKAQAVVEGKDEGKAGNYCKPSMVTNMVPITRSIYKVGHFHI